MAEKFSRRKFLQLAATSTAAPILLAGDERREPRWHKVELPKEQPLTEQVDKALQEGDKFIQGLQKPLDSSREVLSEYYGMPIRIQDQQGRFRLAGREGDESEIKIDS